MDGLYSIGGVIIRIQSTYDGVGRLCHEYACDGGESAFTVTTTQADIDCERKRSAREDEVAGRPVRPFSDAYLETLAVYRKIAERMPSYDTFLFHGSVIAVDGCAYLFAAKSGTGKSTHARLWRELLGKRAVMVNDDKPLIHVGEDGMARVFGTPWDGKHHLSTNTCVPLGALCVLERAKENTITAVTKDDVLPLLLQQAYRPSEPVALAQTLALLERMNVRLYRLRCNMEPAAARLSYTVMSGTELSGDVL